MRISSLMSLAGGWSAYISSRRVPGRNLTSAQPASSPFDPHIITIGTDEGDFTAPPAAYATGNVPDRPDGTDSTATPARQAAGQSPKHRKSHAINAVSESQSSQQPRTSAELLVSTLDGKQAPRPRQPLVRNPKNESHLTKIGKKGLIVTKASKCGHEFHPGGGRRTHEAECPPCKMKTLCANLKKIQDEFGNRGGIIESKDRGLKRSISELDDETPESPGATETMAGRISRRMEQNTHHKLLRGWVSKADLKKERAAGDDPEALGWRRAKTILSNFVDQCEEKVDEEDCWEWQFMRWNQGSGFPGTNSHRDALKVYEEQKEGLQYVRGDPAGDDNQAYEAALARRDKNVPDQLEMPATKKRRLGPYTQVRFNDTVTISAHHDIDAGRTQIRSRLLQLDPQIPEASMRPLRLPEEVRHRNSYWRRPIKMVDGKKTLKKNKQYAPGLWSSPVGYEKAETSWLHESDEQREKDSLIPLNHKINFLDSCKAAACGIQAAMGLPT